MENIYRISSTEKVLNLEKELEKELKDLQSEIENASFLDKDKQQSFGSILIPKDIKYFQNERNIAIRNCLQVREAKPLQLHSELISEETKTCLQPEYTKDSLPILLHQFFVDRVEELIQCKHMHMLRWTRFCKHTKEMEMIFPEYQKRLNELISECHDGIERAKRLSKCRESVITSIPTPTSILKDEDMIVYTRWLVCYLHSIRKINSFVKAIEWIPKSDFMFFDMDNSYADNNDQSISVESPSEKIYGQPTWKKNETDKENVPKANVKPALPKFTSKFKDFGTILDLLVVNYGIEMHLSQVENPSDEMDLFNLVLRKFKKIHYKQEQTREFVTYENVTENTKEEGDEFVTYKKESNWVSFIQMKPDINSTQVASITKLKERNNIDKLLLAQSRLLNIHSCDKVLFYLKEHEKNMKNLLTTEAAAVGGYRKRKGTKDVWTNIFAASKQGQSDIIDFDVKLTQDNVNENEEINSSVKKLGIEEKDTSELHSFTGNGHLLSLLLLRHLKIKDHRQSCLNILNYFRSVERTLTIHDVGLYMKNSKTTSTSHATTVHSSNTRGIGDHRYLYNTPVDYVNDIFGHLQDVKIENHHDFYSIKDNLVQVQDQKGWFVMYDAALKDFKDLELELLLVATHFIEYGRKSNIQDAKGRSSSGKVDLDCYSNRVIDRFAVLLDLWKHEEIFEEKKRQLVDCYLEVYSHVTNLKERRKLAQVIITIIYKRPMFNFEDLYFVGSYNMECKILDLQYSILKSVIEDHITEQRDYLQKLHRDDKQRFGMPLKVVPLRNISVNTSRPELKDIFMLEFHPTLSTITMIPFTIQKAHRELLHMHQANNVSDQVYLEVKLLEAVQSYWNKQANLGCSYSNQARKDIFCDVFVDDPLFMSEIGESTTAFIGGRGNYSKKKEDVEKLINAWCKLLELITYRHRLLEAVHESDVLLSIYLNIARTLGIDECYAFLRPVSFECAQKKMDAQNTPLNFQQFQADDSLVDRFIPNNSSLAICELDEKHISVFNFRSRDGVLAHLEGFHSLGNIRLSLLTQICQKHTLKATIEQLHSCYNSIRKDDKDANKDVSEPGIRNLAYSTLIKPRISLLGVPNKINEKLQAAFISLQGEKSFIRDQMLNDFLQIKEKKQLQSVDEIVKLKRTLIQSYCMSLQRRVSLHAIRAQILAYVYSLKVLFNAFPVTRDSHFLFGEENENKKTASDDLETDPTQLRTRPRRLLSEDGSRVLNIWFVPHYTEVLHMFEDDNNCLEKLQFVLRIVAALHDICQYLCAHARSGSSNARMGSHKLKFSGITADWGGTEGIGAELREIQKQINQLPTPFSPEQVGKFLERKRDVMFLKFNITIAHSVRNTFLNSGNQLAYDSITGSMYSALQDLSNVNRPTFNLTKFSIPEPLLPQDTKAQLLFPWRCFLNSHTFRPFDFYDIAYLMEAVLCGLKDVDRHLVHGEILGVSLLLEDVLVSGVPQLILLETSCSSPHQAPRLSIRPKSNQQLIVSSINPVEEPMNLTTDCAMDNYSTNQGILTWQTPMQAVEMLHTFLVICSRLEGVKYEWACRRLKLFSINSVGCHQQFCHIYNLEVLQVVYKRILSFEECEKTNAVADDNVMLGAPNSISEYEFKIWQLIHLLENFECLMIEDCCRRLSREHTIIVAEKAREDPILPTDIWKKSSTKGNVTVPKPHIVEDFLKSLSIHDSGNDNVISIDRSTFDECLVKLATSVMNREKMTFLNYSTFYENILRHQNQQMYMKEREIQNLKDKIDSQDISSTIGIDCALGERSYALLVEITALRSRIAELERSIEESEKVLKQNYREQYNDVVLDLFQNAFCMKTRFEHFRLSLYDDVHQFVLDVRRSSLDKLKNIRMKYERDVETDIISGRLLQAQKLREKEHENKELMTIITKMKTMNSWHRIKYKSKFEQQLGEYQKLADNAKKENLEKMLLHEEKEILMKEEQEALRKVLIDLDEECATLRMQLKKEQKLQTQRSHIQLQERQSFRHLELAKSSKLDKVVFELEETKREVQSLREISSPAQRNSARSSIESKRLLKQIQQQVSHERSLKLEAFERVDELQRQVHEMEITMTEILSKHNNESFHESCFPIVPGGRVSPVKLLRPISQPAGLLSLENSRPKTANRRPKSGYSFANTPRSKSVMSMMLKPKK